MFLISLVAHRYQKKQYLFLLVILLGNMLDDKIQGVNKYQNAFVERSEKL